jgi:hypothetical protein
VRVVGCAVSTTDDRRPTTDDRRPTTDDRCMFSMRDARCEM